MVLHEHIHRYCKKCMAYAVEDERHFMMDCPAYQEIRFELTFRPVV